MTKKLSIKIVENTDKTLNYSPFLDQWFENPNYDDQSIVTIMLTFSMKTILTGT